jgi:transcriptional regulator with XRE-family HTH domain
MITKKTQESLAFIEHLTGGKLTFANNLLAIRQSEGISQVDFAKLLGISRQYLCDIEHGRRFVSPKMAAQYANTLGYSTNQFVRLCLQDTLDNDGLKMVIDIQSAA